MRMVAVERDWHNMDLLVVVGPVGEEWNGSVVGNDQREDQRVQHGIRCGTDCVH